MHLLNKLTQIAVGWHNYIVGSPETKQMMAARLEICDTCVYKTELNDFGKAVVQAINAEGSLYVCGQCQCPLAGATANPDKACPVGKWGVFQPETSYY